MSERRIDFRRFFQPGRRFEKQLLEDYDAFRKREVQDGALTWPEVGLNSKDMEGNEAFHPFDIDPGLLYEYSTPAFREV